MKTALIASLALVSSSALATSIVAPQSLKPATILHEVKVDSVATKIVGEGFPSTQVFIKATFGNSCAIPKADELILTVGYRNSFDDLTFSLASNSQRVCPMIYKPVTVTIDLGQYSRPNDGLFSKVLVNGVEASATQN